VANENNSHPAGRCGNCRGPSRHIYRPAVIFTAPAAHAWPWQGCEYTVTENNAGTCWTELNNQQQTCTANAKDYAASYDCEKDWEKRTDVLKQRMATWGEN
jgi:hypothetical protein